MAQNHDENKTVEGQVVGTTRTISEELEMAGSQVFERVQEMIRQGNVRRVVIRSSDGKTLIDTTLTIGALAGGALALIAGPLVTAMAAIGVAVVGRVRVEIVREVTDAEFEVGDTKARVEIQQDEGQ
ncbi:MAG: DUF4342 domain-containing protein [Anaerolineae bacterium]|jgi:hypothetical protein|nr:DUF4342 domain-containing protein [Anaerolineae bacterium]